MLRTCDVKRINSTSCHSMTYGDVKTSHACIISILMSLLGRWVIRVTTVEIVLGEVDQMFWFNCTVILAILCGVNSYHCLSDCDENGLIPTRHTPALSSSYALLAYCLSLWEGIHCSNCTPGTGHKLYDNITELVPLERCYSICFSKVRLKVTSMLACRDLSITA